MLVLTRRCGESIRVGHDITFTVLRIAGNQVRIGVAAPREIAVDREEVYERKLAEARCGQEQVPSTRLKAGGSR